MALSPAFQVLALKLQEAAMMHGDVRARLADAVGDYSRANGDGYSYYIDHDGDGASGTCVYCCNGDTKQADYEIGTANGNATCNIDFDNAKDVVPVVSYVPQADDADHYASMDESLRSSNIYTDLPVYERFISQKTRKKADSGSFAGKGRSFPILKAEDVSAALHSIGRAGPGNYSSDTIRANIKRIAKAKGFALPDSLKDDDAKEAAASANDGVRLVESACFQQPLELKESAINPLVKIISAGRGSSGYYTKEVLERDGPQIFKAGTLMYINHATAAEEAARPEGDYSKLAAVTTGDAYWDDNGKDGAALYAPGKVFSGLAAEVAEKAPYTGVSIRANGYYAESSTGICSPDVTYAESKLAPDGKPGLIGKLTRADSIDLVTKAGRDGKLLLESAVSDPNTGEQPMDEAKIAQLIEAAVTKAVAPLQLDNQRLRETLSLQQAPAIVAGALQDIRLPDASKRKILEKLTSEAVMPMLPMKDGKLDKPEVEKLVESEAKKEAAFLMELGYGSNVASIGARMTEAELKAATEDQSKDHEKRFGEAMESLAEIFVGPKLGKGSVDDITRNARKAGRKAFMEGRAA